MNPTIEKIIFIFVGWLLGLASTQIIDIKRKFEESKEIKESLKVELHEYQYRLSVVCYYLQSKYFDVDRDFLIWTQAIIKKYNGIQKNESILNLIERLLKLDDENIKSYFNSEKHDEKTTSVLKKYPVPFLDIKIGNLSWFNKKFQNQVFEIKSNIEMLNQDVEEFKFFYQISFQNITYENHKKAVVNIIGQTENYISRAKVIINLIEKL